MVLLRLMSKISRWKVNVDDMSDITLRKERLSCVTSRVSPTKCLAELQRYHTYRINYGEIISRRTLGR